MLLDVHIIGVKVVESNMGTIVEGINPAIFCKDYAGAMMMKEAYGHRDYSMGWEIDHLVPKSKGAPDLIDFLFQRPNDFFRDIL